MQRQPSGEMYPVAYAQIEKEALATTWALEHWSDLVGTKFTVETGP